MDVFEGIDVNKTSKSKECNICPYWYFLGKGFKFQSNFYNGCHNVLMMSVSVSDIAFLDINGTDYCCVISGVSKSETLNLM